MKKIWNTVQNTLYVVKMVWKICPKRIICEGIFYFLGNFQWIFFSGFFMRYLVYAIGHEVDYIKILAFFAVVLVLIGAESLYESYFEGVIRPETELKIYRQLYRQLYQKAENVELSCFEDSSFYDRYTMAIENADVKIFEVIEHFLWVPIGFISVVVTYAILIDIDPWVVCFAIFPVVGHFFFAPRLNKLIFSRHQDSVIYERIYDYVNRVVHLQDYAKEVRLTNIFRLMTHKYTKAVEGEKAVIDRYAKKSIGMDWLYLSFSFSFIFEAVLMYGGYRTLVSNTMSLAELSVLATMMTTATFTLQDFSTALLKCFENSLYVENFRSFLEYEAKMPEDQKGILPDREIRSVEFRNVGFGYAEKEPVLHQVSFRAEGPTVLALVGQNGTGKTTLIKLLMRLYDPTEGQILVNDIDIREYDLAAYRRLFSAAFQDGKLFSYSIRENILMRRKEEETDSETVKRALKMAGMEQTVSGLAQGADTVLTREFDENGAVLSGGQYQKLIAARAFAKDAPILVFDEPSSALDPIAEYELFDSIMKAGKGHILFFISHRLSSVQNADQVFLLENGRIAEQGTHRRLMKEQGAYEKLYELQARNYRAGEENEFDDSIFTQHLSGQGEAIG